MSNFDVVLGQKVDELFPELCRRKALGVAAALGGIDGSGRAGLAAVANRET